MSTNPFKGIGAINVNSNYPATLSSKMTSLGKQYTDNSKGVWPNSNQSLVVAMTHGAAAYFTIYTLNKDGSIYDRLANNASTLVSNGQDVRFSPEGNYVAFAHNSTPYVSIYKRDGLSFTKLSNPSSLPGGNSWGVSWNTNADGSYLVVVHTNSPYISIYKRSGDTFTKLSNPSASPGGTPAGVAFSDDGTYLAVGYATVSPYLIIYKRSGDTFTKLTDPGTAPTGAVQKVAFSPNGLYLAVAHTTTPFLTIYKRSGDTFTKLANPSTLPASTGQGIAFSPDGLYLAVAHNTTPFCTLYAVDSNTDTFTNYSLVDGGATLPTGNGQCVSFSEDSKVLFIGHTTTPFFTQVGLTYVPGVTNFTNYVVSDELKLPPSAVTGIHTLNSP